MKRKQFLAVITALSLGLTLTGCLPGIQVMDGDGMINENQTPDPIKDPAGNGENGNEGNTDNGNNEGNEGNAAETVNNDDLIKAFLNNEAEAKFDHIITDEDDYYTLDEMVKAQGDYLVDYYFGFEEGPEFDYSATVYYADIDCGADGVKDLGIKIDYEIDRGEYSSEFVVDSFIIMVIDDELKCVTSTEDYYRSRGEFNKYGYIFEGGSGGAALWVENYRCINGKGENIYDYYCEYQMGYATPGINIYNLPESKRGDAPITEYSGDAYCATYVYNFSISPDYPTDLKWDEDGNYDAESKKKYEQYEKDYDKWLEGNIFVFEGPDGNDAELPDDLKQFLDNNNINYCTGSEITDKLSKHREGLGISEEVVTGEEPEWICISGEDEGQGTANNNEKLAGLYIGEYTDDLGDPNLQIAMGSDGKFKVQIGIFRLCFLDDGVGELYDDRMDFIISDDNGNPMEGNIVVDDEGNATVTFTNSDWEYIENGDTYVYTKSSNEPNIFEYEY